METISIISCNVEQNLKKSVCFVFGAPIKSAVLYLCLLVFMLLPTKSVVGF
jgi:hypothetical protein